jgi:hypothetical protein
MSEELEKLKAENAKLEERIAKLEKATEPAKPFVPEPYQPPDYTAGMSMDRSAMQAMIDAIPSSVMSDLRADAFKPNPITGGPNPQPTSQVQRGSGWVDERKLEPPPGIAIMDRMMDEQDRIDKAELALRLAKASLNKGKQP